MAEQLLLVTDDATLQRAITPALSHAGLQVLLARSVGEAQAQILHEHPAVLLLDMALATDALAAILAMLLPIPSAPLVIGMAADLNAGIEALRLGAFDQLCKPLNHELLRASVVRAAEHYQLRAQAREVGRLRAREASLQAAARMTAHNLSQYLTVIMGETQLLHEELGDPEVGVNLMRIVHATEQAAKTLVDLRTARQLGGSDSD